MRLGVPCRRSSPAPLSNGYIIVPGFQICFIACLSRVAHRRPHLLAAVIAAERERIPVMSHCESCAHRLVVGDALRISATHYPYDLVGQLYVVFSTTSKSRIILITAPGAMMAMRLSVSSGKNTSAIFIIPFAAHQSRIKVIADRDMGVYALYAEELHNLEQCCARYMVYHCAVAQRRHGKLFLRYSLTFTD